MEKRWLLIAIILGVVLVFYVIQNRKQKKTRLKSYEELKEEAMRYIKMFAENSKKIKLQKAVLNKKEKLLKSQNALKFLIEEGL